jgi:hypothetical protein
VDWDGYESPRTFAAIAQPTQPNRKAYANIKMLKNNHMELGIPQAPRWLFVQCSIAAHGPVRVGAGLATSSARRRKRGRDSAAFVCSS